MKRKAIMTVLAVLTFALVMINGLQAQDVTFEIMLDTAVSKIPVTARVYVFATPDSSKEPNLNPDPFSRQMFFAKDVVNWKPGTTIRIGRDDPGYPVRTNELKAGPYSLAAVIDLNTKDRSFTIAEGNGYSNLIKTVIDPASPKAIPLLIKNKVKPRTFRESEYTRGVDLKSERLTSFFGRPTFIRAAVLLPPSYFKDSSRRYPIVFIMPGWGGSHYDVWSGNGSFVQNRYGIHKMGSDKIYVYLSADCEWGYHNHANSANNGPRGDAFVHELIPYLENTYRVERKPSLRFLMGQSSGGWGSLWLQVQYPDQFGGCWAVSPDPVDFRDFTGINIYRKGENFFTDSSGKEREIFFMNGKALGTIRDFIRFEEVAGPSEQMGSFNAVFGPRGKDGRPVSAYDPKSGRLNPAVIKHWKKYDVRLYLEENWKRIGKNLQGKLHVYAGAEDNFGLNRPVRLLKESLQGLGAIASVEELPGADHWTIWSTSFTERVQREIDAKILESTKPSR